MKRNWGAGLTWLGRMLWIVPIGLAFIGLCWRPKDLDDVYDLVEKQHDIKFNHTRIGDHSFEIKAAAVKNEEVEMAQQKEPDN